MSYDICLIDKEGKVIHFDTPHYLIGGTSVLGGTTDAWLNVTYNYANYFYQVLGEKGIRTIYGKTGKESIPILEEAIKQLKDDVSSDYWEATEGNARKALQNLLTLARMAPDGIWEGD